MKVLVLNSQSGDWEGLFIDGNLIDQSHVLGEGGHRMYMLEKSEEYGFKSSDVVFKEVNDVDEDDLCKTGAFPNKLEELSGNY